jgi:dephospho-CoA kinase
VLRVGLTGGIGSGKSEVSRRLAALGAVIVDADVIAREVVQPGTEGLAEVAEAFGNAVLLPDGSLDRAKLGDAVFADPSLRARLNAIIHPRVGARMAELESAAGPEAIVVHAVPLLAENELAGGYDLVVVVDAPPEVRLAIADVVIDNSGTLAELDRQVGGLWSELRHRAGRPARERSER